jgi:outer membrane immunogenic protein
MRVLVAVAALVFAGTLHAEGLNMYAGGGFGQAKASGSCDTFAGIAGVSCDDTATSIKGFFGYQVTRYLALEAAVNGFGEWKVQGPGGTAKISAAAVEGDLVGSIPLGSMFSLYGKIGIYFARTETEVNTFSLVGTFTDDNTDLTYGVGGRMEFATNWAGRVEWQQYKSVGGSNSGESDVDVFNVAVMYKF